MPGHPAETHQNKASRGDPSDWALFVCIGRDREKNQLPSRTIFHSLLHLLGSLKAIGTLPACYDPLPT